jgi:hypothetical protein
MERRKNSLAKNENKSFSSPSTGRAREREGGGGGEQREQVGNFFFIISFLAATCYVHNVAKKAHKKKERPKDFSSTRRTK